MLRPVTPFPIAVSPGFEGFAEDVLEHGGAEDVVWTPAGGGPVGLRAIVREKAQAVTNFSAGTTWHPVRTMLVSAAAVQGILPDDIVSARGKSFRVCQGGIHPDGVAMVRVDLKDAAP